MHKKLLYCEKQESDACFSPVHHSPSALRLKALYSFAIALTLMLFIGVSSASASHFRYGNISWRVVGPQTVEFKVSQAFRRSYFFGAGQPAVGSTMTPDVNFSFGDGTGRTIPLLVTSVNFAQDWFYGEATFTKTYAANGNYTAFFESCCRISELRNNAGDNYRVETLVQVGSGNNSPVVALPPIRTLPNDLTNATFPIPATDFEGDALSYRLATAAEMGGGTNPAGLTINATTGFITWTTLGRPGGLYNVAVAITDARGAKTVVDFLISVQVVPPPAPVFDFTVTPSPASAIEAQVGQPVTFNIRATDQPASSSVTIFALGMPAGATLTPAAPNGNPVQTSFSWTPNNTGSFVITFVAEDIQGNQTTTSVTINVSGAACNLVLSSTTTNVTTAGGNNGAIDLSVTGGTAPYSYNWTMGGSTVGTTQDISGLMAGTYTVTVVDAAQCRQVATYTVAEDVATPCNLVLSAMTTNVTMAGGSDGAIDLSVTGGTPPLTYLWTMGTTTVGTTQDLTGLMAGTYMVMVTDASGTCQKMASYTITGPTTPPPTGCSLALTTKVTQAEPWYGMWGAFNGAGMIDLSVSGGTAPYTYRWNAGAATQDLGLASPGTYSVLVTDATGCTGWTTVQVGRKNDFLRVLSSHQDVSSAGASDGSIDLTVVGGVVPATYLWSNGATTEDLTGLAAGTYSVIVTDAFGRKTMTSVVVGTKGAPLALSVAHQNVSAAGKQDGSVDLSVTGGMGPYTYLWNTGARTEDLHYAVPGDYMVTVTDAMGATATTMVQVGVGRAPIMLARKAGSDDLFSSTAGLTAYPNPAIEQATINFSLPQAGKYSLELYDLRGAKVKTLASGTAKANQNLEIAVNVASYAKGVYLLKLVTDKQVAAKRLLVGR
ncbi:T9SS type A sorting domain-containing protein [Adhaeribacter rhizoryzae]|uniref:T9SS type A sorting domain-containing protein n=1 Tax=Adhaeribacter rhizoryzae TaxID=2607907 RepID=A0A5M6CWE0_9BACT|nr:T9SS type A sorting domain-containing protein [Adhaeribacter rhizoryzae]KAA5539547.1 T9SS type A sorting domain-containing protein [Adhaeribacter rhizoryzae]